VATPTDIVADTVVAEAPDQRIGSPEIYFGAWRNEYLGNGTRNTEGTQIFALPKPMPLQRNTLYLYGEWSIAYEYAKNTKPNAEITFKYNAKNVYMVARADTPVTIGIYIDGAHVRDIVVQEDKLYEIVKGIDYGEHVLDIKIEDTGLEAYTFTFG
jgi:hypothetical protein